MGSSDERKTPCHHERSNAEQNKNRSAAPRRGSQWQCRRQCHCYGISAAGPLRLAAPVRRGRSRGLALDQATLASATTQPRPGPRLRAQRLSTARMDSTGTAPRAIVRALRRPGQHRHPCGQPPPYRAHPCNLCGTPQRVCAGRAAVILAPGPPPRSCRPDYAHPRSRSGRRSPTTGSADADTAAASKQRPASPAAH
ncbi:hypothetical protein ABIE52_000052 [Rhodococcus sp. OAS809]